MTSSTNVGAGDVRIVAEVNAEEAHKEAGREMLKPIAVPGAEADGAKGLLAGTEESGEASGSWSSRRKPKLARRRPVEVGRSPGPGRPRGDRVRTIEVREVIASV